MPLKRPPQRRYLPGKWVTLSETLPTLSVASAVPSLSEFVRLFQELQLLEHKDSPPEGLMDLDGSNITQWMTDRIAHLKATIGDIDEHHLNGLGIVKKPRESVSDAAQEFQALADGIPQQRLQIAKSVAARRGIRLSDVLKFVP